MIQREILCTPEKYQICKFKEQCKAPKCENCGKPLSQPVLQDKKVVNSICWHCGTAFFDPGDGFDE